MKNPFGIKARKCAKKDYGFVHALAKKTLFPYIEEYQPINKKEFDDDFNKRYKEIIILAKGGKRIGFYHIAHDIFAKNALYLAKILISPAYQKKGIGHFLMKYFETMGYKRIRLQVWDNNPAVEFYKRLGYKVISKKGHKYLLEKRIE